jgi:hypothetical protein
MLMVSACALPWTWEIALWREMAKVYMGQEIK